MGRLAFRPILVMAASVICAMLCTPTAKGDLIDTRIGGGTVAVTYVFGCCPRIGVGESFTANIGSVLNSVTFYPEEEVDSNVWVALYGTFNGTTANPNPLFVSPAVAVPGDKMVHEVNFDMGAFSLTQNEQYVVLMFGSGSLPRPGYSNGGYQYVDQDNYTGGHFVGAWTVDDTTEVIDRWSYNYPAWEVAFRADFSGEFPSAPEPVPEPSALFLSGLGFLAVRRRIPR